MVSGNQLEERPRDRVKAAARVGQADREDLVVRADLVAAAEAAVVVDAAVRAVDLEAVLAAGPSAAHRRTAAGREAIQTVWESAI